MIKQVILVAAATLALGLAATKGGEPVRTNRHFTAADLRISGYEDAVKRVCDSAHNETNGYSEAQCAYAQDVTGTEYICPNTGLGANCWVELKR